MKISDAILAVKAGKRVSRSSWPEDNFLFIVSGSTFTVNREPLLSALGQGEVVDYSPHIDMYMGKSETGNHKVRTWSPTIDDERADDWKVI